MRKEGSSFTFTLALLDFVPVFMFSVSILLIALRFNSWMFLTGAVLSFAAGLSKASWKMIKTVKGKDIRILTDYFMPAMMSGFVLMLLSVILNRRSISLSAITERMMQFPISILIIMALASMIFMLYYRKKHFKRDDYHSNLIGEIANTIFQLMILLTVIMF